MTEFFYGNIEKKSDSDRFKEVGKINYEQNLIAKNTLALEVGDLYGCALENINIPIEIRETIQMFPSETKKLLAVIVEANNDLARTLGVKKAVIFLRGEIMVGKDRRLATIEPLPGGNSKLSLDSALIERLFVNIRDGRSIQEGSRARREIREIIGHEYHHLKLKKEFPRAYEATILANKPGNYDTYQRDRGEMAADLFGESYARYKSKMETYPDRVMK